MKHPIILSFVLFITLGAFTTSEKATEYTNDLKQEAKDFSLSIIESYFNEDCNTFYNAISDTILVMDGDGIITKAEKEEKLCESLKKNRQR